MQIGLQKNANDPCLFTGHINNPFNPADAPSLAPLTHGLYFDEFVYFSENLEVEEKFQCIIKKLSTVDFMGTQR